ncbi:MAG: 50S ribosomal protein L13 [Thermoplasmata archaeon]|mgnify:CR=1 FL=1|nr:MAG: 50S ribosomal protein L13 [Thermoplasmata archaeon]RLF33646.1 MAG: 50S ribosomal protein L13 [Thermoplasmata archaeon]RLF37565.1 MAG: 50S ribosomal protein L13 [Thermoplasmata archaeon]HDN50629.1 50S ribosomal protein L13 [Thermoplasmatales archaeon]
MTVIDAARLPVGRLASVVAKRLLEGEEIAIINAEQAIISGKKEEIIARYRHKTEVGGMKRKGPYFSRMPHMILKRTVRGMLPYQQPKGRMAYKRLRVFIGVPEELKDAEVEKLEMKRSLDYMTLKELSGYLGITWQK